MQKNIFRKIEYIGILQEKVLESSAEMFYKY